jgi:hypothetical protein
MNPDFVDLLRALSGAEVRFLIVGAYADLVGAAASCRETRRKQACALQGRAFGVR